MEQRKILKSRLYLYLTEFFAGISVMAVELGASRLLAPYFSSSQIVWTIIIGTIMISMALGNIYGGRSADKHPNPDRLYLRILIAAIWIAAIPAVGKYVILGLSALIVFTVNSNYLIWAAFASCFLLFVFPLFLLGTVTPSLVKYTVSSLEHSGRTVGMLNAFNTIGSIIGTFLPTFVTIPAVGTSVTFLIFSGVLLVIALIYFMSGRSIGKRLIAGCLIFALCCAFGHDTSFAFWENNLTYEGESVYNYLQVKEDRQNVILSTNVLFGVQSILRKDHTLSGMYYDYAMTAPLMAGVHERDHLDALILGMGTGTYAMQCRRYFPNLTIEGVEIDEKIIDLSRHYFDLPDEVSVTAYDGRAWLTAVKDQYDVIMVDAYQDITIPFQMSSQEFFTLVREHLRENGVMVVNMNMRGDQEGSINQYLADTIASVFPSVWTVDVNGYTNRELFASAVEGDAALERLERNLDQEPDEALRTLLGEVRARLEPYQAGTHILTDDRAPVELLGMRVMDSLIRDEVAYYKGIYEREGVSGLLDRLG